VIEFPYMKKSTLLTRISEARNLGPVTEKELASIGITSLEQMKKMGWEEVCLQYIYSFPKRLNLNLVCAVIGAITDKDWRRLNRKDAEAARKFIEALRK